MPASEYYARGAPSPSAAPLRASGSYGSPVPSGYRNTPCDSASRAGIAATDYEGEGFYECVVLEAGFLLVSGGGEALSDYRRDEVGSGYGSPDGGNEVVSVRYGGGHNGGDST
jgi:hypothetical protein